MPHLEVFYEAFQDVVNSRPQGMMGVQHILRSELVAYVQSEGLTGEDAREMIVMLQAMDDTFVKFQNRQIAKRQGK